MYKDKDKQREANREASQRRRDKGMTQGMTNEGMTAVNEQAHVIPSLSVSRSIGPEDLLEPTKNKLSAQPKRGKDIKCFADLPPDVQETIDIMSTTDGKIDGVVKDRRTAIAVRYQHVINSSQRGKVLPLLRKYAYNG